MSNKYKHKYLVYGNTPKKGVCSKCFISNNDSYPCGYVIPVPERCIIPEEAFKRYVVSETIDGHWVCSCPRGIFRRVNGDSTCKHVTKVKLDPKKYEVPLSVTVNKVLVADEL